VRVEVNLSPEDVIAAVGRYVADRGVGGTVVEVFHDFDGTRPCLTVAMEVPEATPRLLWSPPPCPVPGFD
jgi:hypothetical protein